MEQRPRNVELDTGGHTPDSTQRHGYAQETSDTLANKPGCTIDPQSLAEAIAREHQGYGEAVVRTLIKMRADLDSLWR